MIRPLLALFIVLPAHAADVSDAGVAPTAQELIAGVIDLTRGHTSYAELAMVIHRPDWERSTQLVAWTRGREDALIRFTAPAKDAGNATLKQGDKMWTFTPKLNRVIQLPYSMMSQGWAGSDFSYSDLARSDQLLHQYELDLVGTQQRDGHTEYTIDAVPHDDAPVVWGKEQLVLRDDYVLLAQVFFDQSMTPLKRLETSEIKTMGGRTFGTTMRIRQLDKPDHWTEITYEQAKFDLQFDDGLFTVFALQSGRSE